MTETAMSMTDRPVALVTGGRRGIGAAIVRQLAEAGYDVVSTDIGYAPEAHAQVTSIAVEAYPSNPREMLCLQHDIGDTASTSDVLARAFKWKGTIDVLVNNAGVSSPRRGDLLEITPESFDQVHDINLKGTFFVTQETAKKMLARPAGVRTIINISSVSASAASIERGEYCISKSAIGMITKLFSVRLARDNIAVFEIRPGIIRTDMTALVADKYERMFEDGVVPMSRWGEPEEIARAVRLLASGDMPFATGSVLSIDGGLSIQRL